MSKTTKELEQDYKDADAAMFAAEAVEESAARAHIAAEDAYAAAEDAAEDAFKLWQDAQKKETEDV